MSSHPPLRAYRRAGRIVLEIDEDRFCADAFWDSSFQLLDRDAFLGFACENAFELLHDDDHDHGHPTWWLRLSQAVGIAAAEAGAGVRLSDPGEDAPLPIAQPPELFPDDITRALLGRHVKDVA